MIEMTEDCPVEMSFSWKMTVTGYGGYSFQSSDFSPDIFQSGRSAVNRADLDVSQPQAGMKFKDGQHLEHRCSLVID